jgi:hypothetical protein
MEKFRVILAQNVKDVKIQEYAIAVLGKMRNREETYVFGSSKHFIHNI